MNSDWDTLQVLGDQAGWHFDALLKGANGYVLVMVDTMGFEMEFVGATPELAVRTAVERLSAIVESVLA
jgi:hypothetical protein